MLTASAAATVVGCGSAATAHSGAGPAGATASAPAPSSSAGSTPTAQPSARATGGTRTSAPPAAHTPAPPTLQASANGGITVTTPSAGTFTTRQSDCGVSSSYAFFHFGVAGSGEESRIDISAGWQGAGTYGPGTFGISASVVHANRAWLVNFQNSSDATLTVDPGGRSGRISYTSQNGNKEAVSAVFTC
jgi:hypothetical protein